MAKETKKRPAASKDKRRPKNRAKRSRVFPPVASGSSADAGSAVLDRLFAVVTDRRTADPSVSHSARLLSRGVAEKASRSNGLPIAFDARTKKIP